MAKAPIQAAPQVVSISDGTTTTKAIQDGTGRIITAAQVQQIRDGQQVELEKVTALRDQLVAGETAAVEMIINQARDEFQRRSALLDLQKADLTAQVQKLKDGDPTLRQEILSKMTDRLNARVDLMTASRDRSDQLVAQLKDAAPGDVAVDVTSVTPAGPSEAVK